MRRRRPRYDRYGYPDQAPYGDPRGYGPPARGYRRPGYGYRRPAGGSCLRDACLLETGCCAAEALDGNCLVLLLPSALPLLSALVARPSESNGAATGPVAARLVAAIRIYQRHVSPRRPACCRFTPSCSEYAAEAVRRHGATRGSRLAAGRLLRCRPAGRRGPDPVPDPA